MSTRVWSYNDSSRIISNPQNYDGAYMRGTQVNDAPKFFLNSGITDNWNTFNIHLTRCENINKPVIFRIIGWNHVPAGWPTLVASDGNKTDKFVDFRTQEGRDLYESMLASFASRFSDRLYAIDIPFPYGRSDEPDTHAHIISALGNGNSGVGEEKYKEGVKWVVDTYIRIFGRKCIGNIGGKGSRAEWSIPHQQNAGVRFWRQDAFGRIPDKYGENRATMYNERYAMLGGANDSFDCIFFEVAGPGVDQEPGYPVDQMLGSNGEFKQLKGTHLGNMGHPWNWASNAISEEVPSRIEDWEAYAHGGASVPPVEPPIEPPPPGMRMEWDVHIVYGTITKIETIPDEDHLWEDAVGEREYFFESVHHAKISVAADVSDEVGFSEWDWPEPTNVNDGSTSEVSSYFRTNGRNEGMLMATAYYEDGVEPPIEPPIEPSECQCEEKLNEILEMQLKQNEIMHGMLEVQKTFAEWLASFSVGTSVQKVNIETQGDA